MQPASRPRSYTYRTSLERVGPRAGQLSAESKPAFRVASPPEFKGEPGVWSPEDLFVAAVNACTMTTFLSFAERKGLGLVSYTSQAEGQLELVEGAFRFTKVWVRPVVTLSDASQEAMARSTMEEAHHKCLISNSMRCQVIVEARFAAGTPA